MKKVIISLLFILLLFNSCIVKSLHPFYTKDSISFESRFIGKWTDNSKGIWNVVSFKDHLLKESKKKTISELSENDKQNYKNYQNSYVVTYTDDDKKSVFRVFPFKVNNQLFLDFSILEFNADEMNQLTLLHLVGVHSLAKFDIESNDKIVISWFDESKLSDLLDNNRIKIKHEKVGEEGEYLLTASSSELQKFLKKYMNSEDEEKWKTDIKFNLERLNE